MRKTSFGLGLAGTILAFLIGIIMLLIGLFTTAFSQIEWDETSVDLDNVDIEFYDDDIHFSTDADLSIFPDIVFGVGLWLVVSASCLILAGILGIVGICITRKRQSTGAGIILIVSAVLSIPSIWGIHASVLFIPAGILAFFKDKEKIKDLTQSEAVVI